MKKYLLDCYHFNNLLKSHFDAKLFQSALRCKPSCRVSAIINVFALLICIPTIIGISGCKNIGQSNTTKTATNQQNPRTGSSGANDSNSSSSAQNSSAANLPGDAMSETKSSACRLSEADSLAVRHIKFEPFRYNINPETAAILQSLTPRLKDLPANCRIEIGNHTDNIGKPAANQALSDDRAAAVKDYLVKLGVPADKLSAHGYADTRPAVSNSTEEGRAVNRRTEFKLIEEK